MKTHRTTQLKTLNAILIAFLLAPAAFANVQIPAAVEVQAQEISEKFSAVLADECGGQVCTPAGCEILKFRTLDETQDSSLPGLETDSEAAAGPLQYKLESLRCEFAYEPSLSAEAVRALRQRITAKVREGGVNLVIQGRKLADRSAVQIPKMPAGPSSNALAPHSPSSPLISALQTALPNAVVIILVTIGILAVIWGFRRLGKPRPVVPPPSVDESTEAVASDEVPAADAGPSAAAILNQREHIKTVFTENTMLAENALRPLAAKGEIEDLCRVLRHFGPEPLSSLAQQLEYREVFSTVREKYESHTMEESNVTVAAFFERLERLIALAQLGRQESTVDDELAFLSDLAPDEFSQLATSVSQDELMAVLAFIPVNLRNRFLQASPEHFIESYLQHVIRYPRVSEHLVRKAARQMRDHYQAKHLEIKSVRREQLPTVEQLLNTLPRGKRENLIERLRKEQPVLFERLLSETLLDGAIVHVPEKTLNEVFLSLTPEEAALYLDPHPDRAKILGKLKAPLAKAIREQSRLSRPSELSFIETDSEEIQDVRRKIVETIKDRSASGEVNLRRLNESVLQA